MIINQKQILNLQPKYSELIRTAFMFCSRIIRGFFVPVIISVSQYAFYLKVVALYRFSILFEIGLREWFIRLYKKNSNKIPINKLLYLNFFCSVPIFFIAKFVSVDFFESFVIFNVWFGINIKYILSNILPLREKWMWLLSIEIISFALILFAICILYLTELLIVLFILDLITWIVPSFIFIYLFRKKNYPKISFPIQLSNIWRSMQEFMIGNQESLLILLLSNETRSIIGISLSFAGLFLYVGEYTINRFVIYKTNYILVLLFYILVTLVYFFSYYIVFSNHYFIVIDWLYYDLIINFVIGFVLFIKLIFTYLRKFDLIGDAKNDRKNIMNFLVLINFISFCLLYYYLY